MEKVKKLIEEKAELLAKVRAIDSELTGRIDSSFGETIVTVKDGFLAIIQVSEHGTFVVNLNLEEIPKLIEILKKFAGEEK